jgi:hypothetical protein
LYCSCEIEAGQGGKSKGFRNNSVIEEGGDQSGKEKEGRVEGVVFEKSGL